MSSTAPGGMVSAPGSRTPATNPTTNAARPMAVTAMAQPRPSSSPAANTNTPNHASSQTPAAPVA